MATDMPASVHVTCRSHDAEGSSRPLRARRHPRVVDDRAVGTLASIKGEWAVEVVNDLRLTGDVVDQRIDYVTRTTRLQWRPKDPVPKTYCDAINRARPNVQPFNGILDDCESMSRASWGEHHVGVVRSTYRCHGSTRETSPHPDTGHRRVVSG